MIQAVIFNLDGVLVSSDECHYKAWKQLAHEQGIVLTGELYRQMVGKKRMDSLRILLKKAERNYSPAEMWVLSARKTDLFNDLAGRLNKSSLLPGAMDTLNRLKEMGVKIAVGSSSENAGGILRHLGIRKLFDTVVDGGDIENGKPDPEVFLLAARKLMTPTSNCLVIENTPAGIEAARQAGIRCIALGGADSESGESERDFSLADLDLPEIVKADNAEQIML
ncbi:MAG: beta-phosphoglucomutase family hydrolase [Clostridia bacterium]|nr:beta-phosphoglucomutase family hydrolase [Clostridia bacterium]